VSAQRFRVWFRKGERVRFISHLDVLRAWERAIRRAELPLSYSQGFTPHPKLSFASPLPLGFVGEAEVMDVTLDERVQPDEFRERLLAQSNDDLGAVGVGEISVSAPPPQAGLLWADYRVPIHGLTADDARLCAAQFMATAEFEWSEERREKTKTYDLRKAVASLGVFESDGSTQLCMRLQADAELTARPEQVLGAVFPEATVDGAIVRTGLVLDEGSPAREAWRRRGQYV
jgi:radical SAM-linked protein